MNSNGRGTSVHGLCRSAAQLLLPAIVCLAGCSKSPAPLATPDTAGKARSSSSASGSWVGTPLRGSDAQSLRNYIQSVAQVTPKQFKAEWSPATVAIGRDAAARAIRSISRDGAVFGLASDEPALAQLKPGSILWIWNVAVRKVQSIEVRGEVTFVSTAPVPLNEAIPNARIEFETPLNLANYYHAKTAQRRRAAPGFLYATLNTDPPAAEPVSDDAWFDEGMSANGFSGEKNGWAFAIGYQTHAGGITLELQAHKAGNSENVDAQIRAKMNMDGFAVSEGLSFIDGKVDSVSTHFKDLNGNVHAQVIGRLGRTGTETFKVPVMRVPVSFNVPIPVGGIPFVVQVGADFTLTLSLAGQNATLSVEGETAFHGDSGFDYSKSKAAYSTDFKGDDPKIGDYKGFSLGVSAVVFGVQIPRLGFGLGLIGVSSIAYVDVVNVITMTNGAAIGGLGPPCKRVTYAAVGHVGIETTLIPLPLGLAENVENSLSPKKEIFKLTKEIVDPPIQMCQIG